MVNDGQAHRLEGLLNPRSIAVVGAACETRRIGGIAIDSLLRHGFKGAIYPVNPRYEEVQGLRCYPHVGSLPEVPDVAVLALGAAQVMPTLERCHAKGIRHAVIYASGYAEEGEEGARQQAALRGFAQRTGMAISGPNCMGHANLHTGAITAFSTLFGEYPPRVGADTQDLAILTQSGAICGLLYKSGSDRGLRFSQFINTGNEAALEFPDYLDYLVDDPATAAVVGYIEGLHDGRRFIDAVDRLAQRDKPLLLLKSGTSARGALATQSHTAALSGDNAIFRAAMRQLGVMVADDDTHLIDLACLVGFRDRSAGLRVAIASVSGGMGAMLADLLTTAGLDVPELPRHEQQAIREQVPAIGMHANPVDLTAQIFNNDGVALQVLGPLARSAAVDVVLIYAGGFLLDRIADEVIEIARHTSRLMVVIDSGNSVRRKDLADAGIAIFTDSARCVRALGTYLRWQGEQGAARRWRGLRQASARTADGAVLPPDPDEHQVKVWLASFGVPACDEVAVDSAEDAAQAARHLQGAVALKILSPDIAHKTEVGGVILNVQGDGPVRDAYDRISRSARAASPEARLRGALVQRMEQGVCELIVGVTHDPLFGPALTVGLGGVFTEVFRDVAHRVLPVDEGVVGEMLEELRGHRLLTGFRGRPPADVDAACAVIASIARAALAAGPAWCALEVNPLLVRAQGKGAAALDALVVPAAVSQGQS